MSNVYLWNFLIFSGYSLTVAYIIASYFIFKYVYGSMKKKQPLSWLGLVVAIAVMGVANLTEAVYHSYNALNARLIGNEFVLLDDPVSRALILFALLFKYYGALLLIFVAFLLVREMKRAK